MTIFEKEEQCMPDGNRWCPCAACNKREHCNEQCLRFNEYVETDTANGRKLNFIRFSFSQRNEVLL